MNNSPENQVREDNALLDRIITEANTGETPSLARFLLEERDLVMRVLKESRAAAPGGKKLNPFVYPLA